MSRSSKASRSAPRSGAGPVKTSLPLAMTLISLQSERISCASWLLRNVVTFSRDERSCRSRQVSRLAGRSRPRVGSSRKRTLGLIGTYSTGMKRRVEIARALMGDECQRRQEVGDDAVSVEPGVLGRDRCEGADAEEHDAGTQPGEATADNARSSSLYRVKRTHVGSRDRRPLKRRSDQ
jgi:hypothetical protein